MNLNRLKKRFMDFFDEYRRTSMLLIGEECAKLYNHQGRAFTLIGTYKRGEGSYIGLTEALRARVNFPLNIIVDTLDQYYRREVLPKVNPFDRAKIERRKLEFIYPNFDIRGAIPLKPVPGRAQEAPYLLVALAPTPELNSILDFLAELQFSLRDIALLPLELLPFMAKMSEQLLEHQSESNSRWRLLLARNETGGMRQIISRDGELALTRLTPLRRDISDMDNETQLLAEEINASLGYLARLGFDAKDGLDVIILGDHPVAEALRQRGLPLRHVLDLTPAQAAKKLKLGACHGPYADDFFALALSRHTLELPLLPPKIAERQKRRTRIRTFLLGAALITASLSFYFTQNVAQIFQRDAEIALAQAQIIVLQSQLDGLETSLGVYPVKAPQIAAVLDIYKHIQTLPTNPLKHWQQITANLPRNLRLNAYSWRNLLDTNTTVTASATVAEQSIARLTLDLRLQDNATQSIVAVNQLQATLKNALPNTNISITKQAMDLLQDQTFTASFGVNSSGENLRGNNEAEITLEEMAQP